MSWSGVSQENRKARKDHRCFCCNEFILKGSTYVARTGFSDGPFTMKMHIECEKATSTFNQDDWDFTEPGSLMRGTVELR